MIEGLKKILHSPRAAKPAPSCRACPVCGCLLEEPGWVRCPRCGEELKAPSPCAACGRCRAAERTAPHS